MENKRRFYRIEYPTDARPKLRIKKKSYEVIDISEEGVKFCYNEPAEEMHIGDKIKGEIVFRNNQSIRLEGRVMRLLKKNIIVKPKKSIPYEEVIIKEEIYVLKNYPLLKYAI